MLNVVTAFDPRPGRKLGFPGKMRDAAGHKNLLAPAEMIAGTYELVFEVGAYFGSEYTFLSEVPVRFRIISIEERYHVPLLVSPWAYSIYRGS